MVMKVTHVNPSNVTILAIYDVSGHKHVAPEHIYRQHEH